MSIWPVESFAAEPTERGRSQLADEAPQTALVEEALVDFAASAKADEPEPDAVVRARRGVLRHPVLGSRLRPPHWGVPYAAQ